jgi:ankyrin repeat protein
MKLLLAAGADPRFVAQDGTNVLLAAAQGGSDAALALALTVSPDANFANAEGVTAMHMLIGGGVRPELAAMLRTLAAHGARTDLKTRRGTTAAAMAMGGLNEVKAIYLDVFPDPAAPKLAAN